MDGAGDARSEPGRPDRDPGAHRFAHPCQRRRVDLGFRTALGVYSLSGGWAQANRLYG